MKTKILTFGILALMILGLILLSGCAEKIIEEQPREEIPAEQPKKCSNEGDFCGGIAGTICCEGWACLAGTDSPNAEGTCVKGARKVT